MLPSIVGSPTLPQPTGRRNPQGGRNPAYKASSPLGCGEVSGGGGGRAGSTRCWQEAAEGCSRVCSSWPSHGAPAPSTHQLWLCRGRVVAEGAQCAGFCPLLGFLFGVEDHRALLSAPPHLLRNTFPPPPLSGTKHTLPSLLLFPSPSEHCMAQQHLSLHSNLRSQRDAFHLQQQRAEPRAELSTNPPVRGVPRSRMSHPRIRASLCRAGTQRAAAAT